jgi:hypothetical protein
MKNWRVLFALLFILLIGKTKADEGMWLPSLMQKLNIETMQSKGCNLTADQIYNINKSSLKDAIVALDYGSCTGELISSDGLMLTNHHCGFGEIQAHSSVEHNYLEDGFWAATHKDELPNPGKKVSFLIRIEDITDQILEKLDCDMDEDARNIRISEISSEIKEEATNGTHYEAKVKSMFQSNQFYLFIYETFSDVRLVGAPPRSIGKFGGDTDNWMWPRHTCDFSLFRVYCGPDGKPADYSEDNIPYHPKHHLPISLKGIEENDFAMVMGYPGSTTRYRTSFGVKYTINTKNEARIKVRSKKLDIIRDYMSTSANARIQYSTKYARSSNYHKHSIGQNRGLKALNVVAKKEAIENDFINWVNLSNSRKEKYGNALNLISDSYKSIDLLTALEFSSEAFSRGPEIFNYALSARSLYEELKKEERNEAKIGQLTESLKNAIEGHFKDYDADTDRKIVAALFDTYNDNVVAKYHPDFFEKVNGKFDGNFEKYSSLIFDKTIFADRTELEEFLNKPSLKTLEKDKGFQTALSINATTKIIKKEVGGSLKFLGEGRRLFLAGLKEMDESKVLYPDANSTMRLTYGTVSNYRPRDGVSYDHFTTLSGYIEKEIPGDVEFHVPQKLKDLYFEKDYGRYADKDGTLHTCFITNNDITGGNSGSPVINKNGELIGCAFDGNWEAMSGDIAFEPTLQKCINVDIRFVLWIIDKFADAGHLVDEMTIVE